MTLLAVAWDIDGTLVDSEPLHHRALVAASLDHGVDLTDLPEQAFRGIHMGDVWIALRHRLPPTLDQERWLADIESYYAEHRDELGAIPGAAETIRILNKMGVRQACVSNSGRKIVDANLDSLGILDCIEFSISLNDVAAGKPDPLPYAEACRRLGLAGQQILAVEDSRTGIRSARAAGLVVAGYSPEVWIGDDVDHAVRRLSDLVRLFSPAFS
ncbi:HAD family hydrolase [Aestuariivirga sp.]|uniref:HAD family hydrolase n=1 Tax=Aestuariivirga sp. TaxID=2650926 RepID=UPI003593DD83